MNALVTGATGFVGSHLVEALRRRGDEVTALARSATKAAALAPLGVRVVPGDLQDAGSLDRAVAGQDVVYHVAGPGRGPRRGRVPAGQPRRHREPGRRAVARGLGTLRPGLLHGGRRALARGTTR